MLFRAESLPDALNYVALMLNLHESPTSHQFFELGYFLKPQTMLYLILCSIFAFCPKRVLQPIYSERPAALGVRIVLSFVLLMYSAMLLSTSTYNPFIYFRF